MKSGGGLWAMGNNGYGELGDGTTIPSHVPKQILPGGVTAIAAGAIHSLFLMSDGSLWGMGDNRVGELGDGTTTERHAPEQIVASGVTAIAAGGSGGSYHSLFIKSGGSLWAMGYNSVGELGDGTTTESHVPAQTVCSGVTAIACGAAHSLFIKSDGSLWAMGYNDAGELGDGTQIDRHVPKRIVGSGALPVLLITSVARVGND